MSLSKLYNSVRRLTAVAFLNKSFSRNPYLAVQPSKLGGGFTLSHPNVRTNENFESWSLYKRENRLFSGLNMFPATISPSYSVLRRSAVACFLYICNPFLMLSMLLFPTISPCSFFPGVSGHLTRASIKHACRCDRSNPCLEYASRVCIDALCNSSGISFLCSLLSTTGLAPNRECTHYLPWLDNNFEIFLSFVFFVGIRPNGFA